MLGAAAPSPEKLPGGWGAQGLSRVPQKPVFPPTAHSSPQEKAEPLSGTPSSQDLTVRGVPGREALLPGGATGQTGWDRFSWRAADTAHQGVR